MTSLPCALITHGPNPLIWPKQWWVPLPNSRVLLTNHALNLCELVDRGLLWQPGTTEGQPMCGFYYYCYYSSFWIRQHGFLTAFFFYGELQKEEQTEREQGFERGERSQEWHQNWYLNGTRPIGSHFLVTYVNKQSLQHRSEILGHPHLSLIHSCIFHLHIIVRRVFPPSQTEDFKHQRNLA